MFADGYHLTATLAISSSLLWVLGKGRVARHTVTNDNSSEIYACPVYVSLCRG
jgi:hypothetical protein